MFNIVRLKADKSGSNRTFMELKWRSLPLPAAQSFSSNRTFMELKSRYQAAPFYFSLVLIAPLWNWNIDSELILNGGESSNRTFMELK